jgi:hypothetical protein
MPGGLGHVLHSLLNSPAPLQLYAFSSWITQVVLLFGSAQMVVRQG